MLDGNRNSVRSTRIVLEPGDPSLPQDLVSTHTIVVTRGSGRLFGTNESVQPLLEGDVAVLKPGRYTLANACERRQLQLLLLST